MLAEEDRDLVRRCLAGDQAGVRTLVERYQGMVFGLCYRILGHREDAEDVVQEVFVRTFRSLERWDPERPLTPWITKIAVNRCRSALSKRSHRPTSVEFLGESLAERRAEPAERNELAEELQMALAGIREDYRVCFIMFYQQELSCAEIGEVLNCPVATVKTWLRRGRRQLVEQLQQRGMTVGDHELHQI